MDKIPDKIRKIIEKYIALLNSNGVKLKSAYLFGGYSKGTYDEWSDIDIALVSDMFEGIRINDRKIIRKITLSVSSSLEVIPFNPKDFTVDNPLAREIIETGIPLI